jgi:N6-adenosine-specific RNA methylase IME4
MMPQIGNQQQSAASLQIACAQAGRQSEKPTEVRRRIEALFGPATRLELFARTTAPGWVCLGNEIDGRDIRAALADPLGRTVPPADSVFGNGF